MTFRYTDDIDLLAENEEILQGALIEMEPDCTNYGMKISTSKPKILGMHENCNTRNMY